MIELGRFFASLTGFLKRLRPYLGQLMVLAGIFGVGLLFFITSLSFPPPSPLLGATSAGTIPQIWFYALVPAVVLALIPIIMGKADIDPKWGENIWRLLIVIAVLAFNIFLIPFIGFYICSAVTIFAIMRLLGERSKIQLAAVPLGWAVFSFFVFARLLDVRLPMGSIFSIFTS